MNPSTIFTILLCCIIVAIALLARAAREDDKQDAAVAEFLIDGRCYNAHILVDTKQRKQWTAVYYDRCLVIVPGTERPWTPAAEKVEP